ncbi:MAG TPA: cytochrome c peroxidase [Saprospiraceae bacterium]|nr:cytochrome c peroxidase [Saprospiraceae bacterium]
MKKLTYLFVLLAAVLSTPACKSDFNYYYYNEEQTKVLAEYLNLPELPDDYTVNFPSHLSSAGLFARAVERDKAVLGRVLFYDKKLSKDGTVSCATCHKQDLAFSDDKAFSDGVYDRSTTRNSFALGSVANFSAYYGTDLNGSNAIRFFWDNRAETAQDQSRGSMTNANEMDMSMHDITNTVASQPYYAPLFEKAFGTNEVTEAKVLEAVANFVNAMGSFQSKFDQAANSSQVSFSGNFGNVVFNQDFSGFTAAENRGKKLYNDNCSSCHSGNMGRPVLALANNGLELNPTDKGVGAITGNPADEGAFKVPTLRNVTLTAPYMHDGRFQTLEEVIDFYSTGIQNHPNLHSFLKSGNQAKKMNFSAQEKADLMAFLNTLTDDHLLADKKFADPFKQ